jgi:hypothetical protein
VAQAKTEGITYNPDGTIDIVVNGTLRHLRRPKLREFRYWQEQLRNLAKEAQEEAVRLQELLDRFSESTTEEEREDVNRQLDEAEQARQEYTTPWIAGVVAQFSDKPLDEDTDEWPAWLALDASIPARIRQHWKTVPLAPGAAGTN